MQLTLQSKVSEFLRSTEWNLQFWVREWLQFRGCEKHLEECPFISKTFLDPEDKERGVEWSVSFMYATWYGDKRWTLRWKIDWDAEYYYRKVIWLTDEYVEPRNDQEDLIRVWTEADLKYRYNSAIQPEDEMYIVIGNSIKSVLIACQTHTKINPLSCVEGLLDHFHKHRTDNQPHARQERTNRIVQDKELRRVKRQLAIIKRLSR